MPEIAVICQSCKQPIADDGGYVSVSHADVEQHQAALRRWEAEHEVGDEMLLEVGGLLDLPPLARWGAWHFDCDPDPERSAYTIEVNRIRSWSRVVAWTAHLMEKNWLDATDWSEILGHLASSSRGNSTGFLASTADHADPGL